MSSNKPSRSLNRREFLGRVSGAALASGAGLALVHKGVDALSAETKLERRNEQSGMIYKPFGKTNLNVSRLSYGCIQLTDDRLPAMETAIERGVNLVHIARGYTGGQAIVALGKFLKTPSNRDKVWVALKGEQGRGLPSNIDDQLKILNTDHVDIICSPIFGPDQIRKSEQDVKKFEAFQKAGKARFLNLTTHENVQQGMEAGLEAGWFTSILATIDLGIVAPLQPTIQKANQQNVGIMAMKTERNKKAGGPDKIAATLLPAGVTTILRSLTTGPQVDTWFNAVTKAPQAMVALAVDHQAAAGDCTLCGLCEGCPNGVAIQSIVRDYTYYYEQQGLAEIAAERYAELHPKQTVVSCKDCGRCELICPMEVPVRRIIREAHARLSATA